MTMWTTCDRCYGGVSYGEQCHCGYHHAECCQRADVSAEELAAAIAAYRSVGRIADEADHENAMREAVAAAFEASL
jgi:hypothetical protein